MTNLTKIPVTVITGFLGAGKTTFIRHLMENAGSKRLAVLVNEFGTAGVDGDILKSCAIDNCPAENIVELANGCICCTVADDFIPTIEALMALPETPDALLYGSVSPATIEFELRKDQAADLHGLPTPLGPVLDEFTISRGTAQSYQLPKGAYVQVIDMEGRQCSDFMAFNAQSLDQGIEHHIDNTVSRTFAQGAWPRPGLLNKFYDDQVVPLLSTQFRKVPF